MPAMVSTRGKLRFTALIVVVAVVAFLYVNGRLDPLLYRFGLNHQPCTHTLSGGTVCGADVAGTPYGDNPGGGGGGPSGGGSSGGGAGGVVGATGGVGKSVSGSAGHSAQSVP